MTDPAQQNMEASQSTISEEDVKWELAPGFAKSTPVFTAWDLATGADHTCWRTPDGRLVSNGEYRMLNGLWVERGIINRRKHWSLSPWAGTPRRKSDRRKAS